MKRILTTLTLILSTSLSFADTNDYANNKSGDTVVIGSVSANSEISLETNFVFLINNSLDLIVNGKPAYSFSIDGTNSFNRGFLENSKALFDQKLKEAQTNCENGFIEISGKIVSHNTALFGGGNALIVWPPTLSATCNKLVKL